MESEKKTYRGSLLWLLVVVLAAAPVPKIAGFELPDLFRAAAVPMLLMLLGYCFEKDRTGRFCSWAVLSYVLIRGTACIAALAVEVNTVQTGTLIPWIRDSLLGYSGKGEGSVGSAWVLPCLLWTFLLLRGLLLLKKEWLRLLLAVLGGAGSLLLGISAMSLPWSLEMAPACLLFVYAGWIAREYDLPGRLASPKWLVPLAVVWCFAGLDGALDLGAKAWPHSVVALVPAFCGGFLGLTAAVRFGKKPLGVKGIAAVLGAYCLSETLMGYFPWTWTTWALWLTRVGITVLALGFGILLWKGKRLLIRHWQTLFLGLMAALVVKLYAEATSIGLIWPQWYQNAIRLGLLAIAMGRIYGKTAAGKAKQLLLPGLLGAAFLGSFLNNGYLFLLDMGLLIFCAMDVPWKKILRVHFWAVMGTFAVIFTASLLGLCPNVASPRGMNWRYYFGSGGPTDFAAHMAFLALTYWVMKDRVPTLGLLLVMLASVAFQIKLTDTRCSETVLLAACVGVLYVALTDPFRDKKLVSGLNKTVDVLGQIMMPLCAVAVIGLSLRFDPELESWQKLNLLFSDRLSLTHNAFNQYGITFFGTDYTPIGVGLNTAGRAGYNFVDSSYCLILVRYGLLPLLAVLILCGLVQKKAAAQGNRKLEIAFMLVAVASLVEHHLTDVFYNPFLLLPFADFGQEPEHRKWKIEKERLVRGGAALAVSAVFALCLPQLILYGQTVAAIAKKWEGYHQWLVCGVLLLVLLTLLKLWQYLTEAVSRLLLDRMFPKQAVKKLGMALAMAAVLLLGSETAIRQGEEAYSGRIEDGKQILSLLEENGVRCQILVDQVPVLFQRNMDGITPRILPVSTANGLTNGLVLTDRTLDCFWLSSAGFHYIPVSEDSALYTNSPEAMALLGQLGYEGFPFCNAENQLDLPSMAGRNKLPLTEKGTILLDGEENPMKKGPYIHLYYGTYRITFRLKVLYAPDTEGELGRAEISSEWGRSDLNQIPFTRENVDEWGRVTVTADIYFPNREQIEFSVFPYGDTMLEVESVTYQKIG